MLFGRRSEREVVDRLIDGARSGRSGVVVVRGEPGIGKTALLEHAVESASDLVVVRAVGVESEMELAFAGLHQLCAPILDRLDRLPAPQRGALAITFGLSDGPAPDRFLVGLRGVVPEIAQALLEVVARQVRADRFEARAHARKERHQVVGASAGWTRRALGARSSRGQQKRQHRGNHTRRHARSHAPHSITIDDRP
jgi:hypothetical protein